MGPDDMDDNFSFPLIEMLDQVFEETLEEVKNHNKTLTEEVDLQVASHVKVVFTMSWKPNDSIICKYFSL